MLTPLNQLFIVSRRAKGLTQEQVAEQTKLTLRTIQRLENQPNQPRLHTLKMVAHALDLPWENIQPFLNSPVSTTDPVSFTGQERQFLQLVNLSALSGLFVPLLNIILPYRLLRKTELTDSRIQECGRELLYKQIWWTVWTQAVLLLTFCFNLTMASFEAQFVLIPYLIPVLIMNGFNGFYIHKTHKLLKKGQEPA